MKHYVTRIALLVLIATSVKSYIFLRGESIQYETFFIDTQLIDTQVAPLDTEEKDEGRGILPDVKLLYKLGKTISNLLPAS